jgi:protein-S-isoprenylcysteine O-methyltransferase Ste14
MDIQYTLISGFCLTGLGLRTAYELLKKADKVDTRNQLIFGLVFLAMCCLLVSWPIMCPKDPRQLSLPEPIRWVGSSLVILGLGLAVGGLIQLRSLENTEHLVTSGLFSKIRHPMYSGFIFWILGWVLHYGAMTSLIVACVCIITILWWRQLEEEKLKIQFGEEYQSYTKQTWF